MIWKEVGVLKGSNACILQTSDIFRKLYIYMVCCGHLLCDHRFFRKESGKRPPIFIYVAEGSLQAVYDDRLYTAQANDILLLNRYRPGHLRCPKTCEIFFFEFDGGGSPAMVDQLVALNAGPVFSLPNARDICHSIREPILRACRQNPDAEASLASLVYATLCMLPQSDEQPGALLSSRSTLTKDMISYQAVLYIDQHIDQHFTVQELADHVHLSRYYFIRLFKKETGYSPQKFVSIAKINYAKMLLQTTTLSVAEIAETLSYSSPASFTNAFRAHCGMAPSKYRSTMSNTP